MADLIFWIVVILLISLILGTPVSGAIGFTAVIIMALFVGPKFITSYAGTAYAQGTSSNQLIAPLFIMMAEFLSRGGIAEDIYYVLNKYLKKLKGGLALSTTIACTVFAALCGSSPATAAAIGRISTEQMTKRGYRKSFAIGTVAGGGTLGIMIPPSLTFVQFGILTETSISKLLMAGLLPGIMLAALMCISIIIRVRINPALIGEIRMVEKNVEHQMNVRRELREEAKAEEKREEAEKSAAAQFEERRTTPWQDIKLSIPAVVLIVLVLGAMYTGLATPTECAGIGVVGAIIILLCWKRLTLKIFLNTMTATARTSAMIIFMLIAGLCLSQVITRMGIATALAENIVSHGYNRWIVMILLYVLWFILGCLMDPGSMVVLTIPFIFPTLVQLGFDPLWIGVVSTLCVEIGMITPPVGLNLFVLRGATNVEMKDIIKGALPYVVVLIVGLVILNLVPQIALIIPSTM